MRRLTALGELYLHSNDALGLPPEVLGPTPADVHSSRDAKPAAPAAIVDYYFRSRREQTKPLLEAKVLLVGQGAVGKTSLVKRLVHDDFDPDEPTTHGIRIDTWLVPNRADSAGAETIRLNVWDFGGQEIMHATHQFFLTKRSLYLLVLDARKGEYEGNLRKWLKLIQSYGADAPVLIVVNQCDDGDDLQLNERRIQLDYEPNVRGCFRNSCRTATNPRHSSGCCRQHGDLCRLARCRC